MEGDNRGNHGVRIFLAEDHGMFRAQLARLIGKHHGMTICGESDNASEALDMIRQQVPDLVIVDIALKGSSGLDLIRDLKDCCPHVFAIVLSLHDESVYAERAFRAGASGYVPKHHLASQLGPAIERALKGETHLSTGLTWRMLRSAASSQLVTDNQRQSSLSPREAEISWLLGQGLTTGEIADQLHLEESAVHSHRLHIKAKLGFKARTELSHEKSNSVPSGQKLGARGEEGPQ